eukprot:Skav228898  [mRNA]  locus=scaffold194:441020:441697:- [translate_table: standard]
MVYSALASRLFGCVIDEFKLKGCENNSFIRPWEPVVATALPCNMQVEMVISLKGGGKNPTRKTMSKKKAEEFRVATNKNAEKFMMPNLAIADEITKVQGKLNHVFNLLGQENPVKVFEDLSVQMSETELTEAMNIISSENGDAMETKLKALALKLFGMKDIETLHANLQNAIDASQNSTMWAYSALMSSGGSDVRKIREVLKTAFDRLQGRNSVVVQQNEGYMGD